MPQHGDDIRASRERIEMAQIGRRRVSANRTVQPAPYKGFRQGLNAQKYIGESCGISQGKRKTAVSYHGGDSVAYGLTQTRRDFELYVVMGVNIDKVGQNPLSGHIEGAMCQLSYVVGKVGDSPLVNTHVTAARPRAQAIKNLSAF